MEDSVPNSTPSRRRSRTPRSRLRRDLYIDQVRVEEPFLFRDPNNGVAPDGSTGEGCYVTATVNNRRYYGVLIDQAALQSASLLHFQEESSGLDLNRRMMTLRQLRQQSSSDRDHASNGETERKRPATTSSQNSVSDSRKRPKNPLPDLVPSDSILGTAFDEKPFEEPRQVQKFRFVAGQGATPGYRELLATFADVAAAAEDDESRRQSIEAACHAGGDFVGRYYFQYEPIHISLEVPKSRSRHANAAGMRMSMGFQMFLQKTALPDWFPLSNHETSQQKVLSIMNMKKDKKGNVLWDEKAADERDALGEIHGSVVPMQPRTHYRVCVVGGGIAGLSSCLEIFRRCERDRIGVEVVLLEGRSRLGGRLWTDRETFKRKDGVTSFPVDLGASWIHGVDLNPLAALARDAGIDFVRTSEDVKMLKCGMVEVDQQSDQHAGELFDKLLDIAADCSWGDMEVIDDRLSQCSQAAVRWYASVLTGKSAAAAPPSTDVGSHRRSADLSVDRAVGSVIANQHCQDFLRLSDDERRMLLWNLKNVEYALGANLSDLSMKFWDIDERHAFEGDHVILRQGYTVVVEHLLQQLKERGKHFQSHLDFVVSRIEYARKSTSRNFISASRDQQAVDLSDTCSVTSQSGTTIPCDFIVCAVPLGVLKEAVQVEKVAQGSNVSNKIEFSPPLPFLKRDAINAVGFGLLDKVYLQFHEAFWRIGDCGLDSDKSLFGNASGINPHHYMFFDIGKSLGNAEDAPAVLMSLVSGKEAVKCECLSEADLVQETMDTIRTIFSEISVPDPIAFRVTRWGMDPFSRGSYTFLPPGATDQDFRALQTPVNGNGDSILLEGSETMRLFFAGEHTTSMHPSMAHGALLSGVRAGEEVVSSMTMDFKTDDTYDRVIPMAVFRHMNPKTPLECSFCHLVGGRTYEGPLLAFKRGSRQVLVHNCCAEFSPEVEVEEGQWRYVLKALNRASSIECCICKVTGASIGCNNDNCYRCFHFRCAESSGWKFEEDGKEFFCDLHRPENRTSAKRHSQNEDQKIQHALFAVSSSQLATSKKVGDAIGRVQGPQGDATEVVSDIPGPLTCSWCEDPVPTRLIRMQRSSVAECWNLLFQIKPLPYSDESLLIVENGNPDDPIESLVEDAIVKSINGIRIGSSELGSLKNVITQLSQEVDVLLEIECRGEDEYL